MACTKNKIFVDIDGKRITDPTGTVCVAWDNASTHQDDEVEVVVRATVGRLVLLYLPTYSPWLNPIEMLWWHSVTKGPMANYLRLLRC